MAVQNGQYKIKSRPERELKLNSRTERTLKVNSSIERARKNNKQGTERVLINE